MRHVLMIVNPTSGRATALARAQQLAGLLTAAGRVVELHVTRAAGDARHWAAALGGSADLIVSVGGDGTLNEIINGLVDAGWRTPILPVAMGTANVVSLELGLPSEPEALVGVALAGRRRSLDIGLVERAGVATSRFVMCLGAGFDAEVVARVHAARGPRGITQRAYARPLLAALLRRGRPLTRVVADGTVLTDTASLAIVANLGRYGGDRRVCAEARCDDGLLNVCWVDGHVRGALPRFVAGWLTDRLRPGRGICFAHASRVELRSAGAVPVQIDGDPAGELPVSVSVLPGAVNVLVPDRPSGLDA
ncbi:MAG: hypothetical protein HZB16_13885 [Armatimonadetes bacterium]|nr:hypothetical protein [Armatimonadota bacterium]